MALLSRTKTTSRFDVPLGDTKKLLKWIEDKHDTASRNRPDFQPKVNLAFYRGQHWLVWDGRDRRLRRPVDLPDDPNAPVRVHVNKVGAQVNRIIAKLTKTAPIPECRPVSDDEDDVSAARVGTRILASETERIALTVMLPELYQWVVPVGYAYLQVTWNAKDGPRLGTTDEGDDAFLGNILVEVVPHFEVALDPAARCAKDARWGIRTIGLPPEEVWERYGKDPGEAPTVRTLADELRDVSELGSKSSQNSNKVAVRQFWMRPGAMRSVPQGLVITYTGNTILEEAAPYPYAHGRLPFIQFNLLPPQGSQFGRTVVDDLIPLQIDYNDSRSREATIRRTLTPKLIYPAGALDPDLVTTRAEQLPYTLSGEPPQYLMPDGRWATQWQQGMERADQEMGEVTGINEAAKGELTGSSPAATVIAQQETASEPLAIPAAELAHGVEQFGWHTLMLVKQFWEEPRLVRTWSEAGTLETDRFSAADITNQLDVHVTQESALPRSKAGRASLAMELWQQQIIQDPRTLIRMLDLPATDVLTNEFNKDVRKQERELGRMLRGEEIPIEEGDNHEIHYGTLNDFMKTGEYENLADDIKGIVTAHRDAHQFILSQQVAPSPVPGQEGQADLMDQGIAGAGQAGQPGQQMPPVPGVTELAVQGGVAGRPGRVPGVSADSAAAAIGE